MKVTKILTPYNFSKGELKRIKYIVIHYVGALGGAKANCNYYASAYIGASAHYFVDFNGDVYQSVEDADIAWHCGAKAYVHPDCRNANAIGIELCVRNNGSQADTSKDWYFEDATVESAIALTKELMKKYGVTPDRVIRHHDVTGKICPNPYVYNHTKHTWDKFKAAIVANAPIKIEPGWKIAADGVRYWYQRPDGSYPTNKWCLINKHWYLFDKEGYMLTGWQKWDGKNIGEGGWYFFDNTRGGDYEGACWHQNKEHEGIWELWVEDKPDEI